MADVRRMVEEMGYVSYSPRTMTFTTELELHSGDVIYTSIFGLPVIVLNSIDSARELMDKRGANYSDRARAVVWNEM